jgi:ABC-type uncharacterized transport system substrate-binding protein
VSPIHQSCCAEIRGSHETGTLAIATLLVLGVVVGSGPLDAQQSGKIKRIGFIAATLPLSTLRQFPFIRAFLAGLHDLDYEDGRNIAIEFRSAEGHWGRLPDIAAELVGLKVGVLVCAVCGAPLNAARQATSAIPIVVAACNDDMVETGVIASLARPGGNITGLTKLTRTCQPNGWTCSRRCFPRFPAWRSSGTLTTQASQPTGGNCGRGQ